MTEELLQQEMGNLIDNLKVNYLFYFSRYLDKALVAPDMLQVMLTARCNVRCKICEVWKQQFSGELTTAEVKNLLDQSIEAGVKTVYFTGGEALLRPDILELVNYAARPGIITTVNTNGSLINEELAEKIVLSRLRNLTFSIDSASAKVHDSIRGKGVFEKAVKGIQLVNGFKSKYRRDNQAEPEKRLDVGMVSVIMRNNISNMIQLADLARSLGCCYLAFQPLIYNGSLLENNDFKSEFMVEGRDIRRLEDSFRRLGSVRQELLSRGFHIDFMAEKTIQHFKKERKVNTCFVGFSRIFVNPQGDISFVCFESIGNIKVDRLSDVWYGQKANAIRKKIRECKVNCTQFCSERPDSENLEKIHSAFKDTITSRFHAQIRVDMLKAEDAFLDYLRGQAGNDDYIMNEVSRIRRDIAGMIQSTAVREG